MPDLEQRFQIASENVQKLTSRPDNATMLQLYGYYKQATIGDVSGKRPGVFDLVGRAKYDAWAGRQGMSREEAMLAYIELAESLA